ncbi:glycosyltransferase [Vineibacter terrae]|uniref:Glycosyltransferase n=1 Tax=Vineibacter terrae TaxID=2586908 RepID=A0A5C8PNQ6_9HYPH|nr:glycosyltransferase [Vineibacter terrae]
MPPLEYVVTIAGAASLLCGVLTFVAALDQRRRVGRPREQCAVPVTVIIPVTGAAPSLDDLYRRLRHQTCPPTRLLLAVESESDPAYRRAIGLAGASAFPIDVVVAGLACHGTQKCHNLAVALRREDLLEEYVVLADADIAPEPTWLSDLLIRVQRRTADIVTGYRWPMPTAVNLPTMLYAWLDRAVATLPKWDFLGLCWGGSLAARRDTLRAMAAADVLGHAVTDDLALADAARAQSMRVTFRSTVLLPTPAAHTWESLLAFGIRQYQFVRLYRPSAWWLAVVIVAVNLLCSDALVVLAFSSGAAALLLLANGLVMLLICLVRFDISMRCAATAPGPRHEWLFLLMPFAGVLLHNLHAFVLLRSWSCRQVVWGRWTYRLEGLQVVGIRRSGWGARDAAAPGEVDAVIGQ